MHIARFEARRAVAPVIAELLMIAVAVSMSVIIFMWSQGFLSQTSSAIGGQQGSQNQAAQSSISIEIATFDTSTPTTPTVNLITRNVGAVAVSIGSITLTGSSANADFKGSIVYTVAVNPTASDTGVFTPTPAAANSAYSNINIGSAIQVKLVGATATVGGTAMTSGDVVNVKVTTTVGTFAQSQFAVP